jgi:hypothetical protein
MENLKYGAKVPENVRSWAIEDFLPKDYFEEVRDYFYNHPKLKDKNVSYYGAKMISSYFDEYLDGIHKAMLPKVKELFEEENMIPSYAIFSDYGDLGEVSAHKDEGPCFFTIDLCLYENTDWPLYIDKVEYIPRANQAVLMYGSHQFHYRPAVNNPNNRSGILLLHYAPPEHQFFRLPLSLQQQYIPFDESQYQFTLVNEYKDIKESMSKNNKSEKLTGRIY